MRSGMNPKWDESDFRLEVEDFSGKAEREVEVLEGRVRYKGSSSGRCIHGRVLRAGYDHVLRITHHPSCATCDFEAPRL